MTKVANKPATKTAKNDVKGAVIEQLINTPAKSKKGKKAKKVVTSTTSKPKVKKSIHETDYGKQVLAVNAGLKGFETSLNGCIKRILLAKQEKAIKLTAAQTKILIESKKKGNKVYGHIAKVVEPSSTGKFSPFKVLQKVRKHQDELLALAK